MYPSQAERREDSVHLARFVVLHSVSQMFSAVCWSSIVFPDDTVLNLGVTFYTQLTTRNHVVRG